MMAGTSVRIVLLATLDRESTARIGVSSDAGCVLYVHNSIAR